MRKDRSTAWQSSVDGDALTWALDPRSRAAWLDFLARASAQGAKVLETHWLGTNVKHRIRCKFGHLVTQRPARIRAGVGLCRVCSRRDSEAAAMAFRARIHELGGEVLELAWLGNKSGHRVRCALGHESQVMPGNVMKQKGFCRACRPLSPASIARRESAAERSQIAFCARVESLGGTVIEPTWLGARAPHRIRCRLGHESSPSPTAVKTGTGICRYCAGKFWDVFYVVADRSADRVKFGITSGAPSLRLRAHAKIGYCEVVRLLEGLPGANAPDLERSVIAALRLAGEAPVFGREHFRIAALPLVLDIVDNWVFAETYEPVNADA